MTQGNKPGILRWSLSQVSNWIKTGQISPVELTRLQLERIESADKRVNAFITVLHEEAMEAALRAEKEILAGKWKGPLHGVPVGLKDIIYTRGVRTTMGSEIFRDYVPAYDAAVVEKLQQAGAVVIGKLNTHQFAYGPTGDRSYFGPVKNPYDEAKISGGSSSGSGAAVAAALCFAALGTDTGGSIRNPSACCGIVGMKPTFGRVSKYGVYPLAWTLDHVGPMTRTVEDNAILLNVLSGYDARDPYSVQTEKEDFTRLLQKGCKGTVIGIPSSFYFDTLNGEVEKQVRQAIKVFQSLGADLREVEIPRIRQFALAQQTIIKCEAYAVHEETLRNHADRYEEEVRERLLAGREPKAYEYVQAQQIRHEATREFMEALKEADVLLTPAIPILPTDIGQREATVNGVTEHVRFWLTRFMGPTNLNGFPSLSIPCGVADSGLPVGLQLIGKPFAEAELYRIAHAFEQERSVALQMPLVP